MRMGLRISAATFFALATMVLAGTGGAVNPRAAKDISPSARALPPLASYLGFDHNDYPGDAVLDGLAQDFAFCGYWLNAPPGETSDSWLGKRAILRSHGFGFLVLFNGRLDKELKSARDPKALGSND